MTEWILGGVGALGIAGTVTLGIWVAVQSKRARGDLLALAEHRENAARWEAILQGVENAINDKDRELARTHRALEEMEELLRQAHEQLALCSDASGVAAGISNLFVRVQELSRSTRGASASGSIEARSDTDPDQLGVHEAPPGHP